MRVLRWFLGTLFGLVLLVLVAAGALWAWSGTEGSARWVLDQVARRQPLVAEGVTGSLRKGLKAERLAWQQDGLSAEARQVELAWQPLALLQGELRLDRLKAGVVRIEDHRPPSGDKPQPPQSVALPIHVAVQELAVGRLEWAGPPQLTLLDLAAGYSWDGSSHHLALRNLRVFDGHYRGDVRLGAGEGLPLDAALQGRIVAPVPAGSGSVALVFDATAVGPLAGFEAALRLQAEPGSPVAAGTRATASAHVTPFGELPVTSGQADLAGLDVGALWPQAPHTSLAGHVAVRPQAGGAWAFSADVRNALPGPWDKHRAPAERVRLEAEWRPAGVVLVRELDATVGGGRVQARGEWEGDSAWKLDGTLTGVNPAAVHGAMAPLPLSGRVTVRADGPAIAFDTALQAAGALPGAPGNDIAAAVGALELRSLAAKGRWAAGELSLQSLVARTADAKVDAALDVQPARLSGRGRVDLEAPGLRVRGVGSLASRSGGGTIKLSATSIGQAQRWLRKLPGVPAAVASLALDGRAEAQVGWQGGWDDPTVQATATVPLLQAPGPAGQPAAWSVRDLQAKVDGQLADARVELRGQAQQGTREATVDLAGRAGRKGSAWQGELASLQVAARDSALRGGTWRVVLRKPVGVRWAGNELDVDAGEAGLVAPAAPGSPSEATLAWDPVQWRAGRLRTAGRLTGVPLAWLELVGGPQLAGTALAGDLVFDANWDAQLADTLRLRASVVRRSGDLSLVAETSDGTSARVQAGVREARLSLDSDGQEVTLALRWDSERAGTADARLVTRLSQDGGGWSWPETAPLSGTARAQLPRLGVWSLLAPPGWRLRGSLAADVAIAGTRADPLVTGTLRADDLALRSVVDGVALQDGRLRARLDGRRLVVEELVLHGAGPDGGSLTGKGEGSWAGGSPQVRVTATLDRLRASSRADRELTVSGDVTAGVTPAGAEVRGDLRVDRARITLPDEAAPRLSDDVVVRNLPPGVSLGAQRRAGEAAKDAGSSKVTLAVNLNFGNDFRISGRGISTRLAGKLVVSGDSLTEPRLVGQIRTVGGEYQAYGQRLDIERGVLRFTGPPDNPALDVLAIRPRLTQRVGVQITGTAQAPFVRLYAEPDLPDVEKLSWLVLGRPAAAGGAETALLQSAALALLHQRAGGGGGKGPAALLGLDELGFRRDGSDGGPAVTLGKRLGRNLYASYERSLAGALGTLYVFYDLTRRVTVRAQAGERAAVDLIFTFQYD